MKPSLLDRALRTVGLQRTSRGYQANASLAFKGASQNRLNMDWAVGLLSADQKLRTSQRLMRLRSRELAQNNDYVIRFLNLAKQNVIGRNGVGLEIDFDEQLPGAAGGGLESLEEQIETAWQRLCERVSTDGQMSMVDFAQAWMAWLLTDGEGFFKRVKGYPFTASKFALQPIDPDTVDVLFNRWKTENSFQGPQNEVRMGVELDQWRRPVAYWVLRGHPGEGAIGNRDRVSSDELSHSYVFKLINQTRGIPWIHTAMTRMHMLGGYEEAELVASRLAACKMAFFSAEHPDDYQPGTENKDADNAIDVTYEPGLMEKLPDNVKPFVVDWNHPNINFPEFTKAMLRGAAMGINVSYATLTGDLRDVNFSSIRQGILDERDGWRILQTFAVEHFYKPVFADWLPMAVLSGEVQLPAGLPIETVVEACCWMPRGWSWVDPFKDVQSSIAAIRSGLSTHQAECAERGLDYRDVFEQRAKEIALAEKLGISLDLTTSGSGGVEGDTAQEDPERAVQPTKNTPAPAKKPKTNGKDSLADLVTGVRM